MENITTFEKKIEKTFVKYAKIPFIISIGMLMLCVLAFYAYNSVYKVYVTQDNVIDTIVKAENLLDDGFNFDVDNPDNDEVINRAYSDYYRLNSSLGGNLNILVSNQDNETLFTTLPSLQGSEYVKYYLSILYSQLDYKDVLTTTINNPSNAYDPLFVRAKRVVSNDKRVNVLFFVDQSYFYNVLQNHRGSNVVITDKFQNIIATSSDDFSNSFNKFDSNERTFKVNQVDYSVKTRSVNERFNVSILTSKSVLMMPILLSVLLFTISYLIINRFNKISAKKIGTEVSESIDTLLDGVNAMKQGNLQLSIPINSGDEFETLARDFEDLGLKLGDAILKNERLIQSQKNAEIKQLEAQFNPHFLYNSLEVIRYLIAEEPLRAESLIVSITKLLRYSIKKSSSMVVLKDDLEYIKLYLEVQKIRLQDRFNYTIDVEESVIDAYLPKLILQPLIENCLKHGYRNQLVLNVGILAYSKNETIYLHVIDDGSGMTKDRVDSLSSIDDYEVNEGYGILSVIQRLKLIYGDRAQVQIDSDSNGTHIMLVIEGGIVNEVSSLHH